MKRRTFITGVVPGLGLAACGGGGGGAIAPAAPATQYRTRMMVQAGNVATPSYNASANFSFDADPVTSMAGQAAAPGEVIGIMEPFKDTAFAQLDAWIGEALKYPQVKWLYMYDELFWASDGKMAIEIGAHEAQITAAARCVQQAGLKSAVSIDSEVVLDPAFKLADANAFDVIMVVIYPSVYISHDAHGCNCDPNPYTNLLACSVQRLRAIGFTGEIWYVYQAFGIAADGTPETDRLAAQLEADLVLQRATVAAGPALGVSGLVAFGFYPYPNLGPPGYAGKGSALEALLLN